MYRLICSLFVVLCISACQTTKPKTSEVEVEEEVVSPPAATTHAPTAVFELTDDNFSDKMKTGAGLRIAYFTATWCGPCRLVGPTVDRVSSHYRDQIPIGKIDVDTNLVDAFNNITTIPTILFFKDGAEVFRTHGIVTEEYLTEVIERLR
jgi:thioredoxin 1